VVQDTSATPQRVSLRPVTAENMAAVQSLRVATDQEKFVASVDRSLADAAAHPQAKPWYRAGYAGDIPVGFVMLCDDVAPGEPELPWRYFLWRLLVDERFQGRGYGRAVLDLVVAYVRTRPEADALVTSVVPGTGSPLGFYVRYGFRPTGEMVEGEQVLRLPLTGDVGSR
jgi:diamine N-acetyltransferase